MFQELQPGLSDNVTLIRSDILKYDLSVLPAGVKVIGNLPYYISSPIMEKILPHTPRFTDIFCTVQLEFGQRLVAKPDSRDYSALSCFAQYYTDARILFKIAKSAFLPAPKVMSCFVHLKPREPRMKADDTGLLFRIVHHAFQQRRKKVINSLTSLWDKNTVERLLREAGITGELRPENIPLNDYVKLANVALKEKAEG
jgi:16S rRNA (adenine1518-N6/adenine1519-N6)-dimethyltransferase